MKSKLTSLFATMCAVVFSPAVTAQDQIKEPVKVTPEAYIRSETDRQFGNIENLVTGIKFSSVFVLYLRCTFFLSAAVAGGGGDLSESLKSARELRALPKKLPPPQGSAL